MREKKITTNKFKKSPANAFSYENDFYNYFYYATNQAIKLMIDDRVKK